MAKATGKRVALFTPAFLEDLRHGKPEPVKHLGPGTWSRRITQEHRLVYSVGAERIDFLQARFHY